MLDQFAVYILANTNGQRPILYVGVTRNLSRRLQEHRNAPRGFVRKYKTTRLVYVEEAEGPIAAFHRESQIKGWTREKKLALIAKRNPGFHDLVQM